MPSREELVPVGIYWDPQLRDNARAAFVADRTHDRHAPVTFIDWLDRVLTEYARLDPHSRAALGVDPPPARGRGQGQGVSRMSLVRTSTLELVDAAIAEDSSQLGKTRSRSAFIQEAVTVGVEAARQRCSGGVLPPPPSRLPANPHPRRPLRRRATQPTSSAS
jgi:hypothetical protein